jgi:hypothetical protein
MGRDFRFFLIRAGNTETKVRQHFGNARHANAADADKMNVLERSEHTQLK